MKYFTGLMPTFTEWIQKQTLSWTWNHFKSKLLIIKKYYVIKFLPQVHSNSKYATASILAIIAYSRAV